MSATAKAYVGVPLYAARALLEESAARRWSEAAGRGVHRSLRWTLELPERGLRFTLLALGPECELYLTADAGDVPTDAADVLDEVRAAAAALRAATPPEPVVPPPPPPPPPPPEPEPEPEPRTAAELGIPRPSPADWADAAEFGWAEAELHTVCVALVHARPPEDVLRVLSREAATGVLPAAEARAWAAEQPWERYGTSLEAGPLGDWTLVVEENGYQATTELRELSAGTAVAVVYSSGADMHFHWAVDGRVLRRFDPLVDPAPLGDGDPLPEEAELRFRYPNPCRAAMVALAQRLTGVRLTPGVVRDHNGRIALGMHPG